jgi:hypothetical protein
VNTSSLDVVARCLATVMSFSAAFMTTSAHAAMSAGGDVPSSSVSVRMISREICKQRSNITHNTPGGETFHRPPSPSGWSVGRSVNNAVILPIIHRGDVPSSPVSVRMISREIWKQRSNITHNTRGGGGTFHRPPSQSRWSVGRSGNNAADNFHKKCKYCMPAPSWSRGGQYWQIYLSMLNWFRSRRDYELTRPPEYPMWNINVFCIINY